MSKTCSCIVVSFFAPSDCIRSDREGRICQDQHRHTQDSSSFTLRRAKTSQVLTSSSAAGKKERKERGGRAAALPVGGRTAAEVIRIIPAGQHRTPSVRRGESGGKDGRFPASESEVDDTADPLS